MSSTLLLFAARSQFRQVPQRLATALPELRPFQHRAPTCAFKQIPPVKENLFKAGVGQFMGNLFDILGVALIMSDRER
jgi:hypothetical protein